RRRHTRCLSDWSSDVCSSDLIAVGDRIDVYVLKVEGEEGTILLSKKRADLALAWDRIQRTFETGAILHAMVVDKVKGGLVVDLEIGRASCREGGEIGGAGGAV